MSNEINYPDFLTTELWKGQNDLQGDIDHLLESQKILKQAIKAAKRGDASVFRFQVEQLARRFNALNTVTKAVSDRAHTEYYRDKD